MKAVKAEKIAFSKEEEKEEKKNARPSQEIMDCFFQLAEFDKEKRYQGIVTLVDKLTKEPEAINYCIERLVTGLSSNRAAARLGFVTALTVVLNSIETNWTVEGLYEVANKKMKLTGEKSQTSEAIGHHSLAASIVESEKYKKDIALIVEKELKLVRKMPCLAMSIAQLIADIANSVDSQQFKTVLLPILKDCIKSALEEASPEFIYLTLAIRKRHAAIIGDKTKFLQKDGNSKFETGDLGKLIEAIRKCDQNHQRILIKEIFAAAKSGNQFETVFSAINTKWACTGDEKRSVEHMLTLAEIALQGDLDDKGIICVFSNSLMKRIVQASRSKQTGQQKVIKAKIKKFCKSIPEKLEELKDTETLLKVILHLNKEEPFDELSETNTTERLAIRLDKSTALKWVESLHATNIRIVANVFKNWPSDVKQEVVSHLMTRPKTDELLKTVANSIDSLFYAKVRAGERVLFTISNENIEVIRAATNTKEVNKAMKKFSNSNLKEALEVLYRNIKIWELLTTDEEERQDFEQALSEIVTIATKDQDQWNVSVLIDLLISLLSRTHRFVRTVVYYVYASLLPTVRFAEVNHIVDSLLLDDTEIEEIEDPEDDDGEDEEDSEMEGESEKDDEEDDMMEEEESEGEMDENLDPHFISKIEEALGDAALKRNSEGGYCSDESLSDMDDETMFAMDEKLSNIFKAMNPQKEKSQKAQAMHEFRSKVMDLLLFTVSAPETPGSVKIELIIPLIELALVQLSRKTEGHLSSRTINLLDILSKQKKLSAKEKKINKLLSGLVEKAKNITNPALNSTLSSLASFIFSLGITDGNANPEVKEAFLALFKQFFTQEEGNLSSEVCTAAIAKYPAYFATDIDTFTNFAFDENIRVFRRTEALQCISALLGKNVIKTKPISKSSLKRLCKNLLGYIQTVKSAPAEVKPRFFATILKVLSLAATNLEGNSKEVLAENLAETIDTILEDNELLKQLKKTNSACNQMCGKQTIHVLKTISKQLIVED